MHKHKLGLQGNGRALICILPDCRTGGKPFVVAGGDDSMIFPKEVVAPGPSSKVPLGYVAMPDYREISLCDICELPHTIVGEFIREGEKFCTQHGERESVYRLPNCCACGRAIRIHIIMFKKYEGETNRFCVNCGAQVLKNGKLVTK